MRVKEGVLSIYFLISICYVIIDQDCPWAKLCEISKKVKESRRYYIENGGYICLYSKYEGKSEPAIFSHEWKENDGMMGSHTV